MTVSLKGLTPSKKKPRRLRIEVEKELICITIEPPNTHSSSSGYSIYLTKEEFAKITSLIPSK